jgi:hypothetical protein
MHEVNQNIPDRVREATCGDRDEIRDRIRGLMEEMARGEEKLAAGLGRLAREVYRAAADAVERSAPDHADSVLREVLDGIGDGVQKTAQTTQYAVEEAMGRGESFAREDLERIRGDLDSLGQIMTEVVADTAERTQGELSRAFRDAVTHTERMVTSIRPSIDDAIEALSRDPVGAASQSASAAVGTTRRAAGAFFSVLAGMLEGTADALDPDRRPGSSTKSEDRL